MQRRYIFIPLCLFISLFFSGCLRFTKGMLVTEQNPPADQCVASIKALPVSASKSAVFTPILKGIMRLPREERVALDRYWRANLDFLKTTTTVIPRRRDEDPEMRVTENAITLVSLNFSGRIPPIFGDPGTSLFMLFSCETRPKDFHPRRMELYLNEWNPDERTQVRPFEPLRASFWQTDGSRIGMQGILLDQTCFDEILQNPPFLLPDTSISWSCLRRDYAFTKNPAWWLLTPFTFLLDVVTIGSPDTDEIHRKRQRNCLRFEDDKGSAP